MEGNPYWCTSRFCFRTLIIQYIYQRSIPLRRKQNVCNFAHDNTLSVADISVEKIIKALEADIDVLQTWFSENGMLLNETKCQFLLIESSRSMRDELAEIKVLDKIITESRSGKLLGIIIDNNITMKDHMYCE